MKIKLMADYESFPLWDLGPDGPRNLDPSALSLSPGLQESLDAWASRYDATLDRRDPARSGFADRLEERAFDEDGLRLASRLKVELGDDSVVVYFEHSSGRTVEVA